MTFIRLTMTFIRLTMTFTRPSMTSIRPTMTAFQQVLITVNLSTLERYIDTFMPLCGQIYVYRDSF